MKNKVYGRQLSMESDTRRALFRSLVRALVINGKIKTTKAKAKAIQGDIEGIITLGKKADVTARRRLYSILGNDRVTANFIVEKVVPAFSMKNSGFTRLTNLPRRVGDNAQMVRLEWIEEIEKYVKSNIGKAKSKVTEKEKSDKKKMEKKNEGKLAKISRALKKGK